MDLEWIEAQFAEMVSLTENWANINSHSYNGAGIEKLLTKVQEAFLRLEPDEIKEMTFENGKALFLKKRPTAPFQIYLGGHLDTVFPSNHPFQKVTYLDDQNLQGPGVTDMKGGLVVMLKALEAFEKTEKKGHIGWEIFLNSDEEIGSPYSGSFISELGKKCDLAFVFEPCLPDGAIISSRKGSANYKAKAVGKKAHAGRNPHEGINAIHVLIHFIDEIQELQKKGTLNVGYIQGGSSFNVVPDFAECFINLRSFEMEEMENAFLKIAEKHKVRLERMTYRPPKPLHAEMSETLELFKECSAKLNIPVTWKESGGVCDGNLLAASGAITLDSLGVRGKNIHTEDEQIYLPSLVEKTKQVAFFLNEIAHERIVIPRKRQWIS